MCHRVTEMAPNPMHIPPNPGRFFRFFPHLFRFFRTFAPFALCPKRSPPQFPKAG